MNCEMVASKRRPQVLIHPVQRCRPRLEPKQQVGRFNSTIGQLDYVATAIETKNCDDNYESANDEPLAREERPPSQVSKAAVQVAQSSRSKQQHQQLVLQKRQQQQQQLQQSQLKKQQQQFEQKKQQGFNQASSSVGSSSSPSPQPAVPPQIGGLRGASCSNTANNNSSQNNKASQNGPGVGGSASRGPTSQRKPTVVIKQALTRGKQQQRASISSCSSSDSYASYGSGYASGSGISTDHELKLNHRANQNAAQQADSANNLSHNVNETNNIIASDISDSGNGSKIYSSGELTGGNNGNDGLRASKSSASEPTKGHDDSLAEHSCHYASTNNEVNVDTEDNHGLELELGEADEEDCEVDEEVYEEEVEADEEDCESSSQLKQHLSELEQLTDDLANRKTLGISTQTKPESQIDIIGKSPHYSSGVRSSRAAQHLLSTGSDGSGEGNAVSSSESPSTPVAVSPSELRQELQTSSSAHQLNCPGTESRSTSTTPTSAVQPLSSINGVPYLSTQARKNGEIVRQSQLAKAQQPQYAKPLQTNNTIAPTATKQTLPMQQQQQQQQQQQISSPPSTGSGQAMQAATGKQELSAYYHNLFQWEQLVSKEVTRPLLINDLDFTDLRDEDDCDLLNTSTTSSNANPLRLARSHVNGEPLTISIPAGERETLKLIGEHDSVDSGTGGSDGHESSPKIRSSHPEGLSVPPPMPPPPISPWFNTISAASRPQSQLMSSPSPPYEDYVNQNGDQAGDTYRRGQQSPTNSTYSNYSRNSVCLPQTNGTNGSNNSTIQSQFNTLQPVTGIRSASSMSSLLFGNNGKYSNKRKKTMKLFWKEVREDRSLLSKLNRKRTIWDDIKPVQVDTAKLEQLFESKAKDLMLSKSRIGLDGSGQRKLTITVLDAKRSNAINIGMTKLPPMRTIKSAILKMDSSIMNREGIEKILTTMMPSEEEKSRIIEAQLANPDTPLGTAEQFLLNLASISALEARLKLWAFQLDYAQIEREVAEPLMDLKQAIEEIERSETFRIILGTLLAIGNFLNSSNAKGFQIDYLEKVPEVKDTVHKHSLLHHLCLFIHEKYGPETTSDLYSEFSAVNRASKVDYSEVAKNLKKILQDCKASWDHLKIVAKHDGLANMMNTCSSSASPVATSTSSNGSLSQVSDKPLLASAGKSGQSGKSCGKLNNLSKLSMITTVINMDNSSGSSSSSSTTLSNGSASLSQVGDQQTQVNQPNSKQLKTRVSDFLTDCAERIMVLMVVHRRVMNRFQKLLVYLGCPSQQIKQTQPQQILKIINEFALEYRTKRERVREMLLRKQQCHNYHHPHHPNRWYLNRTRWAGSQQCMDTIGCGNHQHLSNNRPCSTTSSCFSPFVANSSCNDSLCNISLAEDSRNQANDLHSNANQLPRANSPSGYSQISNYSDYLFDQSCCNSRQQSMTPLMVGKGIQNQQQFAQRPHSMSASMLDLENQHNCRDHYPRQADAFNNVLTEEAGEIARQKDQQLRRLLGAGKSLDETCSDLYQMSHWSSTMTRVTRHQQHQLSNAKQRAMSIDSPSDIADSDLSKRQSSYYKYLRAGQCGVDEEIEPNSDDEILQSLVRTATAKSTHQFVQNGCQSNRSNAKKSAKNEILSRFNCDRKSMRRTIRGGIELSNVG